jgi:hypothetical protein
MAYKTIYTCDNCGREVKDAGDQLWSLGIVRRHVITVGTPCSYTTYGNEVIVPTEKQDWCRSCVEKLGLLPLTPPNEPEKVKELTLAEKLYNIVAEIAVENAPESRDD